MKWLQEISGRAYDYRRKLATGGLFVLALALAYHVVFAPNGWAAYERKKAEHERLQKEVLQMQQDNERLQQEIKNLKSDPKTIEKEAREQLKYTRPGEIVYVMPAPKQASSTATAQNTPEKK